MDKRNFLALAGWGLLPASGQASGLQPGATGPTLLTVAGALRRRNRGPADPSLEPLLARHAVQFGRGYAFDAAALAALPAVVIRPTLEYDAKPHTLRGPLLAAVLAEAGAMITPTTLLELIAVDGYRVKIPAMQAQAWRMIVATHVDGEPLGLGGLGPQWAVLDADRLEVFKSLPLKERFGQCPWGLYMVQVV